MRVHGDSRVQAVGAKEEWIDLHAAVFRPPGRAMFDTLDNSLPHLAPKGIISSNSGITDSRIGVVSRGAFCSSIHTVRFVPPLTFSWKYQIVGMKEGKKRTRSDLFFIFVFLFIQFQKTAVVGIIIPHLGPSFS